jgi:pyrroloquinoline-quinone synthase
VSRYGDDGPCQSCANTPELQRRCLRICEVGAQMRLLYTTALYHDYVEQDLPLQRIEAVAA